MNVSIAMLLLRMGICVVNSVRICMKDLIIERTASVIFPNGKRMQRKLTKDFTKKDFLKLVDSEWQKNKKKP